MPLLGNRLHVLNTIAKKTKRNSEIEASTPEFIVPETKEICSSEVELNRKKTIYESKIWSCRVTGRSALTHREAFKSEQSSNAILKNSIEDHCRSTILEIVHKNASPLEPLVQACWTKIHEQFLVGEPILLKVDTNNPIRATITDIDTIVEEPEVIDLSKDENSSPNNSDKENASNAKKSAVAKKNYRYSVKLESDDPVVVNHVPFTCIQRIHRAPTKDHIRMYIRANAMRYGACSSGPWIVDIAVLRKYCPQLKSATNNLVDKVKLRQVSENYEIKYYEKILSERSKGNLLNSDSAIKLSPKSLKDIKNLSVLRGDSPKKALNNAATHSKPTSASDGKSTKKLKQAVLQFGASDQVPSSGRKNKPGTPNKQVVLPPIAKRLIRSLKTHLEGSQLKFMVSRCASLLSDAQIRALPDDARTLVAEKKSVFDHKKKLQMMSSEEREAYLRDLRQQKRTLIDENATTPASGVCASPLPEPRVFPLPNGISSLQFGRIIGFTEFVACYQSLLTENVLSLGESFGSNKIRQIVADLCSDGDGKEEGSEDEFNSDEEEEAALTSIDAGLPKASIRGLRRLSLDRVLRAVSDKRMSASAYRCLTRPMSALLRLVFLNEQFSKQTELGIQLSKIPITPYTVPELMRLLLSREISRDACSTNDRAIARINEIMNTSTGAYVSPAEDAALGAASLLQQLTSSDLFALDSEHRILAIELLVEWMLDFDTMDDFMHTAEKRESEARNARFAVVKQKRTTLPSYGCEDTDEKDNAGETESNDLASIVKNRRVLAAKAAEERELRDVRKRQRVELVAKMEAEERGITRAEQAYSAATIDAKAAYRANLLGTDRHGRRYWRFYCAPTRLFVETNWAPTEYQVIGDEEDGNEEATPASLLPPAHKIPPKLACCPAASRLGYGAYSNWFVLDKSDEWDVLAGALVDRGLRESHLKKNLVISGLLDNLKEMLNVFAEQKKEHLDEERPVENGGGGLYETPEQLTIEKITANVRGDARAILANVFLKNLFETEIHLRDGGLGGVPDFPGWQATILHLQSQFGLCFFLTGNSAPSTPAKPLINTNGGGGGGDLEPSPTTPPLLPSSPLAGLADALVAVGRNIHRRYLNVPKIGAKGPKSGEAPREAALLEGSNSTSSQEASRDEPDGFPLEIDRIRVREIDVEAWLAAWTEEVRSAATLSRLNVLHACMDACILWEKSVANVRCRICRRNRDDDSLLLCDGCNSGFHLYCLRPPLKAIPNGDWFCASCKPPTQKTSRSRRREAVEIVSDSENEEDEEGEGGEDDEEEEDGGSETEEQGDSPRWRSSSNNSRKTRHQRRRQQMGSRSSSRSSGTTKRLSKTASASSLSSIQQQQQHNDAVCLVCDDEGTEENELIGCAACASAFHANCHNPTVRSSVVHRRGTNAWICCVCRVGKANSGGGISFVGHSLRSRTSTRSSRKNSYRRLHQISTVPKKRPRSLNESESEEDEETSEDDGDQEAEASNDTEATEAQQVEDDDDVEGDAKVSSPPAKRARTMAEFTCGDLISAVRRHRHSWPFQDPVDAKEVPDYYEIVVKPVNLSMVHKWHSNGRYRGEHGANQLAKDLGQMFYNAELYNSVDSDICRIGAQLEAFAQSQFKRLSPPVIYKRDKLN